MDEATAAMEAARRRPGDPPAPRSWVRCSWRKGGAVTGVKVVSSVPGAAGIVAVFGADGHPLGLVDGPSLTAIRTGAASGLATRLLAAPTASVLAMLGAGAMAADQVSAAWAVRPIETVLVWSRSGERAAALAELVGGEVAADPDAAVAAADVVCCATPARARSSITGPWGGNAHQRREPSPRTWPRSLRDDGTRLRGG